MHFQPALITFIGFINSRSYFEHLAYSLSAVLFLLVRSRGSWPSLMKPQMMYWWPLPLSGKCHLGNQYHQQPAAWLPALCRYNWVQECLSSGSDIVNAGEYPGIQYVVSCPPHTRIPARKRSGERSQISWAKTVEDQWVCEIVSCYVALPLQH